MTLPLFKPTPSPGQPGAYMSNAARLDFENDLARDRVSVTEVVLCVCRKEIPRGFTYCSAKCAGAIPLEAAVPPAPEVVEPNVDDEPPLGDEDDGLGEPPI